MRAAAVAVDACAQEEIKVGYRLSRIDRAPRRTPAAGERADVPAGALSTLGPDTGPRHAGTWRDKPLTSPRGCLLRPLSPRHPHPPSSPTPINTSPAGAVLTQQRNTSKHSTASPSPKLALQLSLSQALASVSNGGDDRSVQGDRRRPPPPGLVLLTTIILRGGGGGESQRRGEAPLHRGDDVQRRRRAAARAGRDPRPERRHGVPRQLRPRRRHRRPGRLPRQGPRGLLRRAQALHPAHRRRGPLADPLNAPRLGVSHQLRHLCRGAEAHAHSRGRARETPVALQPPHAGHEPVCVGARGQGPLLPVRQVGDEDARRPAGAARPHQLLQERPLQEPDARPLPQLHQPHGGHPLRRRLPEHVRADALRPVPAPRGAPRRRRLRLGSPARHPLPPAQLGAARRRHRGGDAHPARHRRVRARGGGGHPPPPRPRPRAVRPGRMLQWRLGRHHHARLAQHQVPRRHRHGRHGAVHPDAEALQRGPADGVHHVRLLRVLLRPQPAPALRPVRGRLHHHAQHGLLRVPPRGLRHRRVRRRGVCVRPGGAGPRGGRARVRAGDHHLRRAQPVPRRRRAPRRGVPQRGAAVPVRAPQERAALHRVRQDGRGRAAARRGARGRAAPPARRGRGRVHQPGLHQDHPGTLRHLLGVAGHRQRRRRRGGQGDTGQLLPGDGGGAQHRVPAEPGGGRLHRAARDPGRPAGHLRGAHGLRHLPRSLH